MASSVALRSGVGAWPWYVLAAVIVMLDQYTKGLASNQLHYGVPVEVFSWFNLTLQHNTGAAFSFLSEAGGWQRWFFTVLALVISVGLVIWLFVAERSQWLLSLSLALILGGAIGNVWDRMVLGYVVDFISVHYGGWYFPAFNIADSAITVGAGCMLLESFMAGRTKE
ncbi:signal peptidase II [Halioglobus sp. HI00S01]|uniref:signal peptidase II n=1 Tax=Halioglobus sp. HI00S01 TaxID=1822214 RepID=UPI0007C2DB09|nr:signal peptidase II [Halioglobus sp. HI00S01]